MLQTPQPSVCCKSGRCSGRLCVLGESNAIIQRLKLSDLPTVCKADGMKSNHVTLGYLDVTYPMPSPPDSSWRGREEGRLYYSEGKAAMHFIFTSCFKFIKWRIRWIARYGCRIVSCQKQTNIERNILNCSKTELCVIPNYWIILNTCI